MKKITLFILASLFSVMFVSADPATGLQFVGDNSNIMTVAPNAAFSPAQFTIEVWAKYTVLNNGGYIFSTEGWNPTNHGFSLRLAGSNKNFNFSIGEEGNWPGIDSSTPITVGTWYHLAVTCTATQMTLYVNGVQDATATLAKPMGASTEIITIGNSPAWPNRPFEGQLSDLRFWNVVRTPAQIVADMTSTLSGTETGLVADWKMNEGTGTTVADATGNYNLTKPNIITWFGVPAAINPVFNTTDIQTQVYGNTIEVSNKTKVNLQLSVYSVTGQKVMEGTVSAGNAFQKQLTAVKGSYILKCIAEDGSTYTKKFIIAE
ncbi:MAG: LamG-like jellyroll fold domain-containing protein [Bacteroidota bacterium]|nr:LamG-like jellyroll fold domain-containing protein [Bacteroidota bacterium]